MPRVAKGKYAWRVVGGYNWTGALHAYYVVQGRGTDPQQVYFDAHGAYMLLGAAKETAAELNRMQPTEWARFRSLMVGKNLREILPITAKPPKKLTEGEAAMLKYFRTGGRGLTESECYTLIEKNKYLYTGLTDKGREVLRKVIGYGK